MAKYVGVVIGIVLAATLFTSDLIFLSECRVLIVDNKAEGWFELRSRRADDNGNEHVHHSLDDIAAAMIMTRDYGSNGGFPNIPPP